MKDGRVASVGRSGTHSFTKPPCAQITLIEGLGVEGDAHSGVTVKHRSRVARNPHAPNLRQTHLIHAELFDELAAIGFKVNPGDLGENITTSGVPLLSLPEGTRLHIGAAAILELTGLRNPCKQIDDFRNGLMQAVLDRTPEGALVRKSGVMAVVRAGGVVRQGDVIWVQLPDGDHKALAPV